MKKTSVLILMAMLLVSIVSATPGIGTGVEIDKTFITTGDYKDIDNTWVKGEYSTAYLNINLKSPMATESYYDEYEHFGNAWESNYQGHIGANSNTKIKTDFHAWTVNPPDTTMGTAWTKFDYRQDVSSEYSHSELVVKGYGNVDVTTKTETDSWTTFNSQEKINW